jgi:Domain of unknown function (DUF4290)
MKEYGNNVQKMVDYIVTVEEKAKRTKYAHILVELMRQIHPNMKDNQDYYQKLWDDLYIMSGFQLEVDSPFPPPSKDAVGKKPKIVPYGTHDLRFRHYGRNLELMVEKACVTENPDDRKAFLSYIIKTMKSFYASWNKDNTEDAVLLEQLMLMSGGRLRSEIDAYRRGEGIDGVPKDRYNANYVPNNYRSNPKDGDRREQRSSGDLRSNDYRRGKDHRGSNPDYRSNDRRGNNDSRGNESRDSRGGNNNDYRDRNRNNAGRNNNNNKRRK